LILGIWELQRKEEDEINSSLENIYVDSEPRTWFVRIAGSHVPVTRTKPFRKNRNLLSRSLRIKRITGDAVEVDGVRHVHVRSRCNCGEHKSPL
jgi:hypothetical protein